MQLSNSDGSLRQLPSAIRSLSLSLRSLKDIEKAIQAERTEILKFDSRPTELILPNGTQQYTDKAWHEPDIKKIRRVYVSNGIIFPKYQEGLKAYYAKDWEHAKKCFEFVLSQRVDGPSLHFLKLMEEHDGKCPRNFNGYTVERD
jgi:menaquinone-dependent protoporphyrinogen IX oxidase